MTRTKDTHIYNKENVYCFFRLTTAPKRYNNWPIYFI